MASSRNSAELPPVEKLSPAVEAVIRTALAEDLGPEGRDLTTSWTVGPEVRAEGEIRAGEPGVLSGLRAAARVFSILDVDCVLEARIDPGQRFEAGAVLADVSGRLAPLLAGERVALNFLQRLCGVATVTRSYADALAPFPEVTLLDTRKTTPGLRELEREAVLDGGGRNHRAGLFDAILIKDNHLNAAGGVAKAVAKARRSGLAVEVEVETLSQLEEAIEAGVEIVLLDNMPVDLLRQAVELAAGQVVLEASGGMTVEKAIAAAYAGVQRISVGALTHSGRSLDIGFEVRRTWR